MTFKGGMLQAGAAVHAEPRRKGYHTNALGRRTGPLGRNGLRGREFSRRCLAILRIFERKLSVADA